jgi:hypothetical protein
MDAGSLDPMGYQIQPDSPAKLQGKRLPDLPAEDYFGNPLPVRGFLDIGMHQVSEASEITGLGDKKETGHSFHYYPNPAKGIMHINFEPGHQIPYQWRILNLTGRQYGYGAVGDQQKLVLYLDQYGLNDGIFLIELYYRNGHSEALKFIYIKNT